MTRPRLHPLALLLGFAIIDALIWINANDGGGFPSNPLTHYGWPYPFLETENLELRWVHAAHLALNLVFWFAMIVLPSFALNGLLLRTLHIHLATAFVLMLAGAVLVYANVRVVEPPLVSGGPFGDLRLPVEGTAQFRGWPEISALGGTILSPPNFAANTLVALALLSALALLCEKVFFRRRASEKIRNPPRRSHDPPPPPSARPSSAARQFSRDDLRQPD